MLWPNRSFFLESGRLTYDFDDFKSLPVEANLDLLACIVTREALVVSEPSTLRLRYLRKSFKKVALSSVALEEPIIKYLSVLLSD